MEMKRYKKEIRTSWKLFHPANMKSLWWICKRSGQSLWGILLLGGMSAIISGSFLLLALLSKKILDIATQVNLGKLFDYAIDIILIILIQIIVSILQANLRTYVITMLEAKIRKRLFENLLKTEYLEIQRIHSGELLNRLTSDLEIVVTGMVDLIPQSISVLVRIGGGIIVLFSIDKVFASTVVTGGTIIVLSSSICSRYFKQMHKEVQRTNGLIRAFLQECVENIIVIKSFVSENTIVQHLMDRQRENYKIKRKRTAISNAAGMSIYLVFSVSYYVTLLWGASQIAKGSMTFVTVMALLQIVNQIKMPVRGMSGMFQQYYSMLASTERLKELEELKQEEQTDIYDVNEIYEKMVSLKFENADFAYENGEIILQNVSCLIEKNSFVALVGASGMGKSTILKLLLNLLKLQNGKLKCICGEEEIEINTSLRALFSYVPQGNLILSGSIRENLLLGNTSVTDEDIEKALKTACVEDVVDNLPEKYDTVLGERGVGLSEGQNQRLAIARALLSKAPILLLDEATSALDEMTEERLMKNLSELRNKTIIFVSHRDKTISYCDKVICLDKGKIYEQIQGE